jgi:hypothetical protein
MKVAEGNLHNPFQHNDLEQHDVMLLILLLNHACRTLRRDIGPNMITPIAGRLYL